MESYLPYELYNIIVGCISCVEYMSMRLVCKYWHNIVEESDYCEILKFIRLLETPPEFVYDWENITIAYYSGRFSIKTETNVGPVINNYFYRNKVIYNEVPQLNSMIHEITNERGNYQLGRNYMFIDNQSICRYLAVNSHIIQTGPEVIIANSKGNLSI